MSALASSRLLESRGVLRPAGVKNGRIRWVYLVTVIFYHFGACLAFFPYFFSWTGVVLAVLAVYVFGGLGINVCYHRLLSHQSFVCVRWLERCFAILGVCCAQDGPVRWVAIHRRHHQHTDEQSDPHTPFVSFLWAHIGWLVWENEELDHLGLYSRYARNIAQDRFYIQFERRLWYAAVNILSWLVFYLVGLTAGLIRGDNLSNAVQFGLSLLVWGIFVRTVVSWHITWSVNSITHLWGYKRYATKDESRNNLLIALVTSGEGWHNNHHADPQSANNSRRWWEFDGIYLVIRGLAALGLVTKIVQPNSRIAEMSST